MVDPIWGSVIGAGANLLGGLFGGFGKSKDEKMLESQQAFQQKQAEQQRKWQQQDRSWWEQTAKPDVPRYNTPLAPAYDYSVANAIFNNLQKRWGGNLQTSLGINLPDLLKTTGLGSQLSQSPWARYYQPQAPPDMGTMPPGRGGTVRPGASPIEGMLAQKYGMMG